MKALILIYIIFVIIILGGLTYCLMVNLIDSRQKDKKQKEVRLKMERLNLIRQPIDTKLKGMTLDQFIHYEKYEKSQIATFAYQVLGDGKDDEIDLFSFKLDYYWYCVEYLERYQKEILELWDDYFSLFNKWNEDHNLKIYLNQLCSLTFNAKINNKIREKIDDTFLRKLESYYSKILRNKNFFDGLREIIAWYNYRVDFYYDVMNIGTTESELYYLESIYRNYEKELEQIKTDSPPTFIAFTKLVYHFYTKLPKIKDRNYDSFYRYMILGRIAVLRNIGEYDKMSETIYMFHKGQKHKKKGWKLFVDNILDYGSGYGEKPSRLLLHFGILHIIFFFVFYPYPGSPVVLGIEKTNTFLENIVDVLYFNSTTLLSNLYGNIPPVNWLAKIVVVVQQILGFIVTGSFIALFLRKIFRY